MLFSFQGHLVEPVCSSDYLTKWPEVFPVQDQTVAMIATLLVEEIMNQHGVPSEILSDRG